MGSQQTTLSEAIGTDFQLSSEEKPFRLIFRKTALFEFATR
jgi:hypothetical protein